MSFTKEEIEAELKRRTDRQRQIEADRLKERRTPQPHWIICGRCGNLFDPALGSPWGIFPLCAACD